MAIKCWTIALTSAASGAVKPAYYYKHTDDSWVNEFQGGCIFFDKKSCEKKYKELNVFGPEIIEGSVE